MNHLQVEWAGPGDWMHYVDGKQEQQHDLGAGTATECSEDR